MKTAAHRAESTLLESTLLRKVLSYIVCSTLILSLPVPYGYAQGMTLPNPGTMLSVSPAFQPVVMKGLRINPDNPLEFGFLIDEGQTSFSESQFKEESEKLIRYFLAALTVPDEEQWVNLSPYEEDRIITEEFGQTDMGMDLLAQDYLLKQLTASLLYPEGELGQEFWKRIKNKTDSQLEAFNKVWIVPEKSVVFERGNTAIIVEARLKVMLEADYFANHQATENTETKVIKEIIIPAIEKEINTGKNFASLRQIYHSLILAHWYKRNLKESILVQGYADQNIVKGIDSVDAAAKEKIYAQYLEAYRKGAYNLIKEEYDPQAKRTIPKKYFSGGFTGDDALVAQEIEDNFAALSDQALASIRQIKRVREVDVTLLDSAALSERAEEALRTEGLRIIGDANPSTREGGLEEGDRVLVDWGNENVGQRSYLGVYRRGYLQLRTADGSRFQAALTDFSPRHGILRRRSYYRVEPVSQADTTITFEQEGQESFVVHTNTIHRAVPLYLIIGRGARDEFFVVRDAALGRRQSIQDGHPPIRLSLGLGVDVLVSRRGNTVRVRGGNEYIQEIERGRDPGNPVHRLFRETEFDIGVKRESSAFSVRDRMGLVVDVKITGAGRMVNESGVDDIEVIPLRRDGYVVAGDGSKIDPSDPRLMGYNNEIPGTILMGERLLGEGLDPFIEEAKRNIGEGPQPVLVFFRGGLIHSSGSRNLTSEIRGTATIVLNERSIDRKANFAVEVHGNRINIHDAAMAAPGGMDFTPGRRVLEVERQGPAITFNTQNFDQAMLKNGLVPIIKGVSQPQSMMTILGIPGG